MINQIKAKEDKMMQVRIRAWKINQTF